MKLIKKQQGASMVEYAILIAVIVGAVLVGLGAFGGKLNKAFEDIGTKVEGASK